MNYNDIYQNIIDLGGDCFASSKRPSCQQCPFKNDCLKLMLTIAKPISKETRLRWALNKVFEQVLFNDDI